MNVERKMGDQFLAFAAGASSAYLVGSALGVAPPIIGEHQNDNREWAKRKWGKRACQVMEELDTNWNYMLIRPKASNRNYVLVQPEQVRVKFVCYTSPWERAMRGVAKFGEPTAKGNRCICGGAVAAAADQILGLFSISMILFPVVTANLDVQLKENIPLGAELGLKCKILEGSDSIKKLVCSLTFYSLEPEHNEKEYAVVTAIFVNSILPSVIKSML
jgi:hypothetical protein